MTLPKEESQFLISTLNELNESIRSLNEAVSDLKATGAVDRANIALLMDERKVKSDTRRGILVVGIGALFAVIGGLVDRVLVAFTVLPKHH